ncbi:MAG: AraC family transcriptional regulator [Calditrichaeota bacterium]|nr:MAG: AraC family transcriptional regulator [Calditrichota bacterium]
MNNLDTISTILILGSIQGFAISFILFSKKGLSKFPNKILGTMVSFFSKGILIHTIYNLKIFDFNFHAEIISVLFLIIAPLLYFYSLALSGKMKEINSKDFWHFLPFGLGFFIFLPTIFLLPNGVETEDCIYCEPLGVILILQNLVYIFFIFKNLQISNQKRIYTVWLRFLVLGYFVTWVLALLNESHSPSNSWNFIWIYVSAFMYAIGYFGLKNPDIFEFKEEKKPSKKYEKSTLSEELANQYLAKLEKLIETEKPYLENDLTLVKLAKKLKISTHHLSQILNERRNQNFYDFVNSLRIEEAKRLILDPKSENLNFSDIGYESGFNSVSAFNTAFKKFTNRTPSEFRKNKILFNRKI